MGMHTKTHTHQKKKKKKNQLNWRDLHTVLNILLLLRFEIFFHKLYLNELDPWGVEYGQEKTTGFDSGSNPHFFDS